MSKVVHFEIPATNPQKIIDFYQNVFGWRIERVGSEKYWLVQSDDAGEQGINGAIYQRDQEHDALVATISVKDLNKVIEQILEQGGKVVGQPTVIPNFGRYVYFEDPEGTMFSLMEAFPED